MAGKLPPDAFDFYLSLGAGRSYLSVADRYRCTKKAVSKKAAREDWQGRIAEIERKAREATDKKAVEALESVTARHLKIFRAILGKGIETLKQLPLDSAMNAVRAIDLAAKQERALAAADGQPQPPTELSPLQAIVLEGAPPWMAEFLRREQCIEDLLRKKTACDRFLVHYLHKHPEFTWADLHERDHTVPFLQFVLEEAEARRARNGQAWSPRVIEAGPA